MRKKVGAYSNASTSYSGRKAYPILLVTVVALLIFASVPLIHALTTNGHSSQSSYHIGQNAQFVYHVDFNNKDFLLVDHILLRIQGPTTFQCNIPFGLHFFVKTLNCGGQTISILFEPGNHFGYGYGPDHEPIGYGYGGYGYAGYGYKGYGYHPSGYSGYGYEGYGYHPFGYGGYGYGYNGYGYGYKGHGYEGYGYNGYGYKGYGYSGYGYEGYGYSAHGYGYGVVPTSFTYLIRWHINNGTPTGSYNSALNILLENSSTISIDVPFAITSGITTTSTTISTTTTIPATIGGSLFIEKIAVGGDGTFNFTALGPSLDDEPFHISTTEGTGSFSFDNLTPGTYVINEHTQTGWELANSTCDTIIVTSDNFSTCQIINVKTNTTTTISTGTPPRGEPGGGGGSESGGNFAPTVLTYTNGNISGFSIFNLTNSNCKTVTLAGGKVVTLCVSQIGPINASVIVNGASFILPLNVPVQIDPSNGYNYYAELTNVSYVPRIHTIAVILFASPITSPSTPSSPPPSSIPTTTIQPSRISIRPIIPQLPPGPGLSVLAGLTFLSGFGTSRLSRRFAKGSKKEYQKQHPAIRLIEGIGLIEIALIIATVWLFFAQFYILALIAVFALGVALTYLIDRVSSGNGSKFDWQRRSGALRYLEEFGIGEVALFVVVAWAFINSLYMLSLVLTLILGVSTALLIDKTRSFREMETMHGSRKHRSRK